MAKTIETTFACDGCGKTEKAESLVGMPDFVHASSPITWLHASWTEGVQMHELFYCEDCRPAAVARLKSAIVTRPGAH